MAAFPSDLSPTVKQVSDDVMNTFAKVDKGLKLGSNEIAPKLFDWHTSRGSGTGVIHQPYDLGNELGKAGMSSEQLHVKFGTAIHRALF